MNKTQLLNLIKELADAKWSDIHRPEGESTDSSSLSQLDIDYDEVLEYYDHTPCDI